MVHRCGRLQKLGHELVQLFHFDIAAYFFADYPFLVYHEDGWEPDYSV